MHGSLLLFGCTIWIPLTAWIIFLVNWMIYGDIDPITGIVGVFVSVALGYLALNPPTPIVSPLIFGITAVTTVLFPFIRIAINARELRSVDVDALSRAYETLSLRPNNPVVLLQVARHVYAVGMPGHALAIAESALASLPVQHFRDEHRLVARWKASVTAAEDFRPIPCVECQHPNPPGAVHCERCGAPFLLDRARGRAVGKSQGRKLVAAWVGLVLALVGVAGASALPPAAAVASILFLLAAAGAIVYLAFRSPGGAT